jgi:O-6-methylguanine DNA methyltransferase
MFKQAGSGLHVFETIMGPVGFAWTPKGICQLDIGSPNREATLAALQQRAPGSKTSRPMPQAAKRVAERIKAHCKGQPDLFKDIPVDLRDSSEFSRDVLRVLRRVKPGKVVTYGELAKKCHRPGASRAIGRIMGANPVPLIIPCHRCVGASGKLTGFSASGGIALKARMLHREGFIRNPEHEAGLTHLKKHDKKLARIINIVGPYQAIPEEKSPPYDTLVRAIAHQQLSVKAGETIALRVRDLTPGKNFPTPEEVLALDPQKLRGCGLSNAKTGYVRDLATHIVDGRLNLNTLRSLSDEKVIEKLTKVRGIGVWSAHMHLMFHLGRLDILPTGDLGVRMGAAKLYSLDEYATPAELTKIAEKWRPYRSLGSWYLWQALNSGGLS